MCEVHFHFEFCFRESEKKNLTLASSSVGYVASVNLDLGPDTLGLAREIEEIIGEKMLCFVVSGWLVCCLVTVAVALSQDFSLGSLGISRAAKAGNHLLPQKLDVSLLETTVWCRNWGEKRKLRQRSQKEKTNKLIYFVTVLHLLLRVLFVSGKLLE